MNREKMSKKLLNRRLFDDECSDDVIIQEKHCTMDEMDMLFDEDLLSGRELFDLEGGLDEDYICLDRFLSSQGISFFHE